MIFSIEEKHRDRCDQYLDKALDLFSNGGLSGENIIGSQKLSYILHDFVRAKEPIDSFSLRSSIGNVVSKMSKEKLRGVDRFLELLHRNFVSTFEREPSLFSCIASLNIDYHRLPKKNFTVDGKDVQILNYSQVDKQFKISQDFRKMGLYDREERLQMVDFSYALMEVKAATPETAFSKANAILEFFRAVLNFAELTGQYRLAEGGYRTLSVVQPDRSMLHGIQRDP